MCEDCYWEMLAKSGLLMDRRASARGARGSGAGWGGRRSGAGRKANIIVGEPRRSVSHKKRVVHGSQYPVHVTLKAAVRCLRTQRMFAVVRASIRAVNWRRKDSFRVVEFSVQSNHIHLVVEARNNRELSRGVQALCVRLARRANRVLGRRGRFFVDRYHGHELRSAAAVKNVIAYVLGNFRKHGTWEARAGMRLDPYSSAPYFAGFAEPEFRCTGGVRTEEDAPVIPARTWLLRSGWRSCGLISVYSSPGRQSSAQGAN